VVATTIPLWVEARIVPAPTDDITGAAAAAGTAGAGSSPLQAEPEPEPEPEQQQQQQQQQQSWKYKALGAGVIRSGVSKDSEEVGRLEKGEVITVRITAGGMAQACLSRACLGKR
jgi:hypothetical protein